MRILVTGGAGFIGSHIVDTYIEAGHNVWVIDNESSGRRAQVNKKATFLHLDISDKNRLHKLFQRVRFDVVNHHAAQIDVRHSVEDPIFDAKVNVLGLINLLTRARDHKVRKVLFSSSGGTVYGECTRAATEMFPERPLSPYGVAKLAGEKYIQAFYALHGLKYTIFRYSNVYGPRQDPHGEAGVVAIFCQRFLKNQQAYIYGDGKQTRDFVFVKDIARANLLALRKADNQVINIGVGTETSVNTLFSTLAAIAGLKVKPVRKPGRVGELRRSVLNAGKARRVLGWSPKTSLKQGLFETFHYFRSRSPR